MGEIVTILGDQPTTLKKLAELSSMFIILEKVGSSGEVKILPRVFEDQKKALDYLGSVDDAIKNSLSLRFKKKNHQYFIIPAMSVEFLL